MSIQGGSLATGDIACAGAFLVSGGSARAGYIGTAGDVSLSDGSLDCEGLTSGRGITMTGGSVTSAGEVCGLNAAGSITLSGGTLVASGNDPFSGVGLWAEGALTISGSTNVDASGYDRALLGSPIKIAGKTFTGAAQRVVVVNGKLQSGASLPVALIVGGRKLSPDEIKNDQAGEGWAWRAADRRLTLNGYDGGGVVAYTTDFTLYLASGNKNTIASDSRPAVYALKNLKVSGSGAADLNGLGAIVSEGSVTLSGGCLTYPGHKDTDDYGITAKGNVAMLGGSFTATLEGSASIAGITTLGGFSMRGGSMTIKTGDVGPDCKGYGILCSKVVSIGGGRLYEEIRCGDGFGIVSKRLSISGGDIESRAYYPLLSLASFSITGGVIEAYADGDTAIYGFKGDCSVKNARITCSSSPTSSEYLATDIYAAQGNLSVSNSFVCSVSDDYSCFALASNKALKITDSLVLAKDLGARKFSTSGSLLFRAEGANHYYLYQSATLAKSFSLPSEYDYRIPKGRKLTIKKDAQVRLYGSAWTVEGSVSGVVVGQAKPVASISIAGPKEVSSGRCIQLTASALPTDASYKAVRWISADESIATVSSGGLVTGGAVESVEKVTITAKATDGSGASANYEITVYPLAARVTITPSGTQTIDLTASPALSLSAAVVPAAARQACTWKSSNSKVASVDPNTGVVTGIAPGTVMITATAADGSKVSASAKVNVTRLVRAITVTGDDRVVAGRSIQLKALFDPENVSNRSVTWSVDNPLFTVSANGLVTAKKTAPLGLEATITAVCKDAGHAGGTYTVTVAPPASTLLLSGFTSPVTLAVKDMLQLSAAVEPTDALQRIVWSSSSDKIASVNATGLVTAKRAGTVTITAQAADGSKVKTSVKITVT